jgi:hypothetical protein
VSPEPAAVLSVEQYAEFATTTDHAWAVIGDPGRLQEWTGVKVLTWATDDGATDADDALATSDFDASGWTPGAAFHLSEDAAPRWQVISRGQRVVEVSATTSCGQLGIGVRVIGLRGSGTRVVFVARLEPSGSSIRARIRDVPRIRRRFDRWSRSLRAVIDGV